MPAERLMEMATEAMRRAYAPYSGFPVGAALEAADGRAFSGCNVENASYPVAMCAERVALGAAVAAGARSFRRLALTSAADDPATPCGMCRQALAEFGLDLEIESLGQGGTRTTWTLADLLPESFVLEGRFRRSRGEPGGAS